MSPDKKKRLNILRKKLDSLDNNLIKLIKKRTNIVRDVLKLKTRKYEIVDKKRISIILKNIKNKYIQLLFFPIRLFRGLISKNVSKVNL